VSRHGLRVTGGRRTFFSQRRGIRAFPRHYGSEVVTAQTARCGAAAGAVAYLAVEGVNPDAITCRFFSDERHFCGGCTY